MVGPAHYALCDSPVLVLFMIPANSLDFVSRNRFDGGHIPLTSVSEFQQPAREQNDAFYNVTA